MSAGTQELTPRKDVACEFYQQLIGKGEQPPPISVAVVMPIEPLSLRGAAESAAVNLIRPILVGPEAQIRKVAAEAQIELDGYRIVDCPTEAEALKKTIELVHEGDAEAIMKGHIATHDLMHAIVAKESGLRTERRMSHVFAIATKDYRKPLFLSDAAVNIRPDLMTKRDIVQNAIDLFHALGMGIPKVAILSATEHVTPDLPDTLEAAALCKMADRGMIRGGIIDGPLAFDNAISKEAAEAKGIKSEVAGDADILITPDLISGNMLYKQMRYMAGYEAAGIVMGAAVPIILTSRAATRTTRMASCALAVMCMHGNGKAVRKQPEAA